MQLNFIGFYGVLLEFEKRMSVNMKNGLRSLAPNQKLRFFLTSMIENFEEKQKRTKKAF